MFKKALLILFLPVFCHAIEELPDDKVDTAEEVSIINRNLRFLETGKLDIRPKNIIPKQTATYSLGYATATWAAAFIDSLNVSGSFAITGTWDGWVGVSGTWSYASATTITVPAGAASIYQKGDKIKITQTTVKYFYVVSVADTVLTVTGGSDYSVANAAITSPSYSKTENPQGFPHWFNTAAPTWVVGNFDNSAGAQPDTIISRFKITGQTVTVYLRATGHKATTNKYINFNPSVYPAAATVVYAALGPCFDGSSDGIGTVVAYNSTTDWYFIFAANIPDNTVISNGISAIFSYEF